MFILTFFPFFFFFLETTHISNSTTKIDFNGINPRHWIFRDCRKGIADDWSTTVSASHIGIHFLFLHGFLFYHRSPWRGVFNARKSRDGGKGRNSVAQTEGASSREEKGRGGGGERATPRENGPFRARWNMDRLLQLACNVRRAFLGGVCANTRGLSDEERYDRSLMVDG